MSTYSKSVFTFQQKISGLHLRVSAKAIKNINKKGITAVVKEARANGVLSK